MTTAPGIHLLIVDDVEMMRVNVGSFFELRPCITKISYADDGDTAIEAVETDRPDVIIMDIRMPRVDGIAASRIIRDRYPDVAIIIHSAYEDDAILAQASEIGTEGYFLKGSPVRGLIERVETAATKSIARRAKVT